MPVTLRRHLETSQGTLGQFSLPSNGTIYTMERKRTGEHPHIPAGTYEMRLGMYYGGDGVGGKKDYPAYELIVPGRDLIKIHIANRASELLGCIAPGLSIGFLAGELAVMQSRVAFTQFMVAMKNVESDYITIFDAPKEV